MLFISLLRSLTPLRSPQGRAQHRPAVPRTRPQLEALEDRCLPTYGLATSYAVAAPYAIATADLNGDGKLDLITAGTQTVITAGSQTVTQTVSTNKGSHSTGTTGTSMAISSITPLNSNVGTPITFTATVTALKGKTAPGAGSVAFYNGGLGGTLLVTATSETTNGTTATFSVTTSSIAAGNYSNIQAFYTPSTNFGSSNSAVFGSTLEITSTVPVLQVLLGNGDGTFAAAQTYPVPNGGWSVAVGDFNGDHKLDIVTGNGNGMSVLLGNGDGTFQTVKNFALPLGTYLAAGDLNGDGKLDLVTSTRYPEATVVLLGYGDGTFQAGPTYTGSGAAVAVGDFNADGKLDVVTKTVLNPNTGSSVLNLLPGNGDGTFGAAQPIFGNDPAYPVAIEGVAVGDFNGDGTPDLAAVWVPVGYYGSIGGPLYDQEIVLLGGSGGFRWPTDFGSNFTGLYSPLPYSVVGLAAADVNGDGKLDLIAMNDKGYVDILSGNGDGTFGVSDHSYEMAYSTGNLAFVVGDFNGDGFPDLAALRRGFVDVYLWTSKTQW
jgi:hypothetical protein